MARYTRYRKYSRRFRSSGKWSTRINNFSGEQLASPGQNFVIYQNLTNNPPQTEDTVSIKYTVKNINCQLQLETENSAAQYVENLQVFVMYIPQGFIPTGTPSAYADVPFQHPEWIMAHRFYGSPQIDGTSALGFPALRLSSRLARKLDTGDRIVVIILGTNTNSQTLSATLSYRGLVKYNTKAN